MDHLTETCLQSLSATSYGPHETGKSGITSTSRCSVNSSSRAGLSFGPLQTVDGDHSRGYHSHQDPYSVTMYGVLCFALTGKLVHMVAAAHSAPRTSDLLPHGLLQYDLDRSGPLCVWLRIQRDCVNLAIWAAFLCIHHCPFLHTCGKYPHDPQNTLLATTS